MSSVTAKLVIVTQWIYTTINAQFSIMIFEFPSLAETKILKRYAYKRPKSKDNNGINRLNSKILAFISSNYIIDTPYTQALFREILHIQ